MTPWWRAPAPPERRAEIIERLHLLPAYRYNTAAQVWEHLPKRSVR